MATLNIKNMPDALYRKIKLRAKNEHRSVSQEVTRILEAAIEEPEKLSIMGLRGLGKEIWKGIDPAKYIEEERNSWDCSKDEVYVVLYRRSPSAGGSGN